MNAFIANLPWAVVLPTIVTLAFLVGLAWKYSQDKAIEVVKSLTLKPGDLHVRDLHEYARTHTT